MTLIERGKRGDMLAQHGTPSATLVSAARATAQPHAVPRIEDVPDIQAPFYPDIARFALTFDGYHDMGAKALSMLSRHVRQEWMQGGGAGLLFGDSALPLDIIRALLFFEQRRHWWNESEPRGQELRYVRALVAAIAQCAKEERYD